jgi:hypothetical protein
MTVSYRKTAAQIVVAGLLAGVVLSCGDSAVHLIGDAMVDAGRALQDADVAPDGAQAQEPSAAGCGVCAHQFDLLLEREQSSFEPGDTAMLPDVGQYDALHGDVPSCMALEYQLGSQWFTEELSDGATVEIRSSTYRVRRETSCGSGSPRTVVVVGHRWVDREG